ncbi:uncharacterized protein CLUP02_07330 [Colletotrichum lupini]|uniref:Uncharacterized protein n=1 Tax=Colletotrichum lupini TaxID=145971 RepID=A0A9Q8SQS9_9PEZI|nr:uncharacterized protein CLUP02_07330 [Colletotrichum lupini]UQC81844.1 hypothetical protein CLUP02_07330 [Colletotrichum lupini]
MTTAVGVISISCSLHVFLVAASPGADSSVDAAVYQDMAAVLFFWQMMPTGLRAHVGDRIVPESECLIQAKAESGSLQTTCLMKSQLVTGSHHPSPGLLVSEKHGHWSKLTWQIRAGGAVAMAQEFSKRKASLGYGQAVAPQRAEETDTASASIVQSDVLGVPSMFSTFHKGARGHFNTAEARALFGIMPSKRFFVSSSLRFVQRCGLTKRDSEAFWRPADAYCRTIDL